MKWVEAIVSELYPSFGGLPTFCEDSDALLDIPEVREALRKVGMTIDEWDGSPESLAALKCLQPDERPLLVVTDPIRKHIVTACLENYQWTPIAISDIMPRFNNEIVKSVPTAHWDTLLELHTTLRYPLNLRDTALLVARAVYGVDTLAIEYGNGWLRLLSCLACGDDTLPLPVAREVAQIVRWPTGFSASAAGEAMQSPSAARTLLLDAVANDPQAIDEAAPFVNAIVSVLRESRQTQTDVHVASLDLLALWAEQCNRPQDVLQFGLSYAAAAVRRDISQEVKLEVNALFYQWLKQNYALMLSAPNPETLRLPRLLDRLDADYQNDKLLLLVVDSLSLRAWEVTRKRWQISGIIGSANTRAAFAVLPTITSLSRRAIFEGKPPSQFLDGNHSVRLERQLWTARYRSGDYHTATEIIGIQDSFARSRNRICVVDVTWDKRGHSIDPRLDSIESAAGVWADNTKLREIVKMGLEHGYRVIITADHGQVECRGTGRPNVGILADERSKRVIIFDDEGLCRAHANESAQPFHPSNLSAHMWPLFAMGNCSFDLEGAESVSHGGLTLDEVLVPVAEVLP
jgi:hypothetical protein